MKRYKLKINYYIAEECVTLDKDSLLYLENSAYYDINGYSYSQEFIENNPDIFELQEPLFYTEDFEDGSYPEKLCDVCLDQSILCSIQGKGQKNCHCWNGELKGQAIYEGDKCWKVGEFNTTKVFKYDIWDGTGNDYFKYFSNESNARAYFNELRWKDKLKFKVGDKIHCPRACTFPDLTITKIDYLKKVYKAGDNNSICFIHQNSYELYTEPKFEVGNWAEVIEKPLFEDSGNFWYKSDFKKGDLFWSNNDAHKKGVLTRFSSFKDGCKYIAGNTLNIGEGYYSSSFGINDACWNNLRRATSEEEEWMQRCEKAGKSVPKSRIPLKWKMYVPYNMELSKLIQQELFKEGYYWGSGGINTQCYSGESWHSYGRIIDRSGEKFYKNYTIITPKDLGILPKFTTADGVDKYIGDTFYSVNTRNLRLENWTDSLDNTGYDFSVGEDTPINKDNCVKFSSFGNAQQYLAEQIAKKRGIEVGTEIFYGKNRIRSIVANISYDNIPFVKDKTDVWITSNSKSKLTIRLENVCTLEELAKEEGLEVGMEISSDLLTAYAKSSNLKYSFNSDNYIKKFIIPTNRLSGINRFVNNKACFKITGADLPIVGFKKFKEEWEIKHKLSCNKCQLVENSKECKKRFNYIENCFLKKNQFTAEKQATEDYLNSLKSNDAFEVNGVEVIDTKGRSYTNYNITSYSLDFQGNGPTLKLFIK